MAEIRTSSPEPEMACDYIPGPNVAYTSTPPPCTSGSCPSAQCALLGQECSASGNWRKLTWWKFVSDFVRVRLPNVPLLFEMLD